VKRNRKVPTEVTLKARAVVVSPPAKAKPVEQPPRDSQPKKKVIAALKRLHPMD
jgi:hypothetical protein